MVTVILTLHTACGSYFSLIKIGETEDYQFQHVVRTGELVNVRDFTDIEEAKAYYLYKVAEWIMTPPEDVSEFLPETYLRSVIKQVPNFC